jgi:hypothetical protein
MATTSHPTTLCLLSGVPAGAAAKAGPIVPLPGGEGGGPWLKCSRSLTAYHRQREVVKRGGHAVSTGGNRPEPDIADWSRPN